MVKVILWDWDNTLVDSFQAILAAQNDMRTHFGLSTWSVNEAKKAMNTSGRNLLQSLFDEKKIDAARSIYLDAYMKHSGKIQLKSNATEALRLAKEKGFYNILASNKIGSILRNEVNTLKVNSFFDRIIGAEDCQFDKPSKSFTDEAIKGLQIDTLISIGDGQSDVQMARNYENGISVLIGTNPHSDEFGKIKPDLCFSDLHSLMEMYSSF